MADEAQLVDDAVEALKEISSAYRGQPIAALAAQLSHQLSPQMAFDADIKERERQYEIIPNEFAKEAKRVAKKAGPKYQTPVFNARAIMKCAWLARRLIFSAVPCWSFVSPNTSSP